jgi:hypothetical protein
MNPSFSGELSSVGTGPRAKSPLLVLSLLAAAAFAAWNLSSWPDRLRYPADLAHIEGMRLAEIRHFRQGLPVYAPASAERFDAMIYGPLYYFLGAQLVDPERPSYLPLRLLGMMATLGLAAAAALLAGWLSGRCAAALLAALWLLSYSFVSLFGLSARCDIPALLISFCGFLVSFRFRNDARVLWSLPLFLLAVFYKQQFVAAPAAVVAFLFVERRWRHAAQFAGLFVAGGVAGVLAFQFVLFRGQDFLLHWVGYNVLPLTWTRFGDGVLFLGVFFLAPGLLALAFLRRSPNRLLACYLSAVVAITLAGLSKEGSAPNYFLELVALLTPLASAQVTQSLSERREIMKVAALFAVSLAVSTRIATLAPSEQDFERDRAIQSYLRANFRTAAEGAAFYTGRLLRAGLATPISDLYVYSWLACTGKIDEADWRGQFESRRFGVLLLTTDLHNEAEARRGTEICLSDSVRRAILQNYQLRTSLDLPFPERAGFGEKLFVWIPRLRDPEEGENGAELPDPGL